MIGLYTENVRSVLLLVPRSEALELPIGVERANLQRPHVEYEYAYLRHSRVVLGGIYISTKTSTVCCILDSNRNFPDFRTSRKSVE